MKGELTTTDGMMGNFTTFIMFSIMLMWMALVVLPTFTPATALAITAQGRLDSFEVTAKTILQSVVFAQPCLSMVVHNDGDNLVHIWINSSEGNPTPLEAGESLPVDYGWQPVIISVFYQDPSGESPIRIIGAY